MKDTFFNACVDIYMKYWNALVQAEEYSKR